MLATLFPAKDRVGSKTAETLASPRGRSTFSTGIAALAEGALLSCAQQQQRLYRQS
jgi:hypothetical protein